MINKQSALEQIREEAFRDELEKVALVPKSKIYPALIKRVEQLSAREGNEWVNATKKILSSQQARQKSGYKFSNNYLKNLIKNVK